MYYSRSSLALSCFLFFGCSSDMTARPSVNPPTRVSFGPELIIGNAAANPSTPFLRYAPDGRLFAVWTEDHDTSRPQGKASPGHHGMSGKMTPSPMRNVYLASSSDGGETWSQRKRVNSEVEAVQGEENGPKIAFSIHNRAHVAWSIPAPKATRRAPIFASPLRAVTAALRRRGL